jgi:hypothetical protein
VQAVKQTVMEANGLPLDAGYRLEDRTKKAVFASADAREGPRAFMEKRSPTTRAAELPFADHRANRFQEPTETNP